MAAETLMIAGFLLSILAQASVISIQPGESIQAAIDEASPGDIIEIQTGIYNESINVTKRLVLKGIPSDGKRPIIDACGRNNAVTIRLMKLGWKGSSWWVPTDGRCQE